MVQHSVLVPNAIIVPLVSNRQYLTRIDTGGGTVHSVRMRHSCVRSECEFCPSTDHLDPVEANPGKSETAEVGISGELPSNKFLIHLAYS